jgi:hypothetical protein
VVAVEFTRSGLPGRDDPAIVQAMEVWEKLTADEQRNVFEGVARAVTAFGRTKEIDHLVRLSESVDEMVLLERQPGFTEARRAPAEDDGEPGVGVGIAEVVRRLRE